MTAFCCTIHLLHSVIHGRADGGEPEWPPSPLRLFQALVAAAAGCWNERQQLGHAVDALRWLEPLGPPEIVAPSGVASEVRTQFYVPDNTADLIVPQFKKGIMDAMPKRTEKVVRPTHVSGEAVHYLYPLPPEGCPHEEVLKAAARSITHLGWGIDMVAADARVISQEEADKLPGHRWRVVESGGVPLRVPKTGTLEDLIRKHEAFLNRLSDDGFRPVPPLTCFDVKRYHSPAVADLAPVTRPCAAFEIHRTLDDQERNPGKSRYRPFHHVRRVATVAGMVRHATSKVARLAGHPEPWVDQHVAGHGLGKNGQATTHQRLSYLPLPSITPVGVSGIRRVLVAGWPGCSELANLRRRLNGEELIDQDTKEPVAVLSQLATTDREVMKYIESSRTWCTVTPVILPGFDDPDRSRAKLLARRTSGSDAQRALLARLDQRIIRLLWRAFEQAGWTPDSLDGAELEYRKVGWLRGLEMANNYVLPKVPYPRYHVRVTFRQPVRGPLVIGAGRYRGFGLFARDD